MKKIVFTLTLCVCLLAGLVGCGTDEMLEDAAETMLLSEEGTAYSVGETCADEELSITVASVSIADFIYAPLSEDSSDVINVYSAAGDADGSGENADADALYLDCTFDVENVGDETADLDEDLMFFAVADDTVYSDYLLLIESDDRTELTDADLTLDAGEQVRAHYAVLLPTDISTDALDVGFVLPEASEVYRTSFDSLAITDRALSAGGAVKTNSGAMLTIESASLTSSIDAVSDAGGGISLQPAEEHDGNMVDIVLTVQNDSEQALPLGTLLGGRMVVDGISTPGTPILEAEQDMNYSGSIAAGESATAHLVFDASGLSRDLTASDSYYLYVDGMYYPVTLDETE